MQVWSEYIQSWIFQWLFFATNLIWDGFVKWGPYAKQAIIETALSKAVQMGLSLQMATRRSYIKWIKNKEKQKANKHRQIEQTTTEAPPRNGQ